MFEGVITAVVTGAALAFFIWFSNRNTNATECYLGWGWRIAYGLFAIICIVGAIGSSFAFIFSSEVENLGFIMIASYILSPVFTYFAIDGFVRRISWDRTGLTFRSLFKKERHIGWHDVVAIKPLSLIQAESVHFRDGSKVAFSKIMVGSKALKLACFEYGSIYE